MRLVAGFVLFATAASMAAACASEQESIYEIDDGRPDASLDSGIGPGWDEDAGFATCDPDYCPLTGPGAPCCVGKDGPCGMDNGSGCSVPGEDPGDVCDPDFCPTTGPGAPCCVTQNGPCGMDNGLGCQAVRRDAGRQ